MRPYLYNCFKVTSCYLATPFVWPSYTSLFYFQAAFIAQIFFHIWSTFQSFGHYWTKVNWPPVPVAIPPYFLKIEKPSVSHRCSSLRQSMSADENRTLLFSYASHLLCYPYLFLIEGAAEPGKGPQGSPQFSVGLSLLLPWLQVRMFASLLVSLERCLGSLTPSTNNTF